MSQRRSTRRPWKDFPYYKVQVYNERECYWEDYRRAFQTKAEAEAFVAESYLPHQRVRLMIVEDRRRRRPLAEISWGRDPGAE